jgi:hypothetical protein
LFDVDATVNPSGVLMLIFDFLSVIGGGIYFFVSMLKKITYIIIKNHPNMNLLQILSQAKKFRDMLLTTKQQYLFNQ